MGEEQGLVCIQGETVGVWTGEGGGGWEGPAHLNLGHRLVLGHEGGRQGGDRLLQLGGTFPMCWGVRGWWLDLGVVGPTD